MSGGKSEIDGDRKNSQAFLRASNGLTSIGAPFGIVPSQYAAPFFSVRVAWLETPIKEKRDQAPPCSADSNKKVPGRFLESFR